MKSLINLKNMDRKYFMWCQVRMFNLQNKSAERMNKKDKRFATNLNYSDIEFPLDINDYEVIENRFEININVFGYEIKIYPLYISEKSHTQTLKLLLITEKDKPHYVFIKDFNKLMFSRTIACQHHCLSCLQRFTTEAILSQHKKQCLLINGCQAVNYESGAIKFATYNKQIPIPFKIYADTECFLKRTNSYEGEYTIKYQEHLPNSIGAKLVCIDDRFTLPSIIFKGKDCIYKFVTWVLDKQKWTQQITKQYFHKKLKMTNEDEEIYENSHLRWICKQELNMDKVRDYFHVTGRFRGAAHNKCNINLSLPRKLLIIFHNLQGYDGHIIFKELNNFDVDTGVILKGIDKYMRIIVNRHITFVDSLEFYNGLLDTLASTLNNEDFKHLTSEFGIDKLEILKRKDAYPYEWVDSDEKFKHSALPKKKHFYSSLKDGTRDKSNGHISDENYQHLQNVWNTFNFNTFEDFHDHYVRKDVLLLADVFEKFIFTCLKYYDLDPCHYFSAPRLS